MQPMRRISYLWTDRRYLIGKRREDALMWVAWHLPRRLVMWSYYRVGAHATTGRYDNTDVTSLTMMDAIERWPIDVH